MSQSSRRKSVMIAVLVVMAAIVIPLLNRPNGNKRSLVLYCAHDAIFAEDIIRKFEQTSGIDVDVRYDEETNKSLGLTNLLIAEKDRPRCDVFWNNQTLGTIRLTKQGLLAPLPQGASDRIPEQFKDLGGTWCGFAGRFRVYIVNNNLMGNTETAVQKAITGESLTQCAIAVPLFGTTYSHYVAFANQYGLDALKAWHQSHRDRGIREVRGNGAVKDLVGEGVCSFGFTDTDDFFAAKDAGKRVAMVPVRLDNGKTICIPNSVAIIRDCPHPAEAEQFVRYLLSAEVEVALSHSKSRQVPLGPVPANRVQSNVRDQFPWVADTISFSEAAEFDDEVLEWLTGIYAGG